MEKQNNERNRDRLKGLWEHAVWKVRAGEEDSTQWFTEEEETFLSSVGIRGIEFFDYADDYVNYGEPDFETFFGIHDLRREYLLDVQQGKPSGRIVTPEALPSPGEELDGKPWFPRIIAKARGKLRGELDPDVMYSCPNDRRFLKEQGVSPAAFLKTVMEAGEDTGAIIAALMEQNNK